jgi:hypothetical protein
MDRAIERAIENAIENAIEGSQPRAEERDFFRAVLKTSSRPGCLRQVWLKV